MAIVSKKKVLIADPHPLFRRGLRALLSAEENLQVVGDVSSAAEALALIPTLAPDVLLMNLDLLTSRSSATPLEFRQAQPKVALLLLASEDAPQNLETAIASGAAGYMLRTSPPRQIVSAVQQLNVSEEHNAKGISKSLPDLKALANSSRGMADTRVLTPREEEVVRLLAEGLTVREVASELFLSAKTVEAHKLNLMRKLDIHNRASLVEYAYRKGLVSAQLVS